MAQKIQSLTSLGEHFWPHAFFATILVYALVLGSGFWHPDAAFQITPSIGVQENAQPGTPDAPPSLEVELLAPPASPPINSPPTATPTPEPTSPAPQPPPIVQPPPTPLPEAIPIPVPAPALKQPPISTPAPKPSTAPTAQKTPAVASKPSTERSSNSGPATATTTGASTGPASFSGVALGSTDFPIPPYPPQARERGFQGVVTLNIRVQDGLIQDVSVESSSGYTLLDSTATRWIRSRWRFPKQLTRTFHQKISFNLAN
ncbi:MAG: TonB family protein [Verrucomicrobiota bacterium]